MNTLPLISYPLMVTLIDDDSLLLQALTGVLIKNYKTKEFTDPLIALEFFKNYEPLLQNSKFLRGCTEFENYDVSGHLPVDVDLLALEKLRQRSERVNDIGVIIIDYNMPGMTGIDFCRELKELPIKKILLTGEANNQLAVTAFNEGIIDCFIRKDSITLVHDIKFYLNILTQQYFIDNTKHLLKHLETDNLLPVSDPAFITFFHEWCNTHKIREFYLIDQNANFLLIDENNQQSYFITHTDRTLANFIELHEENSEAENFVTAVKSRTIIPFFGQDKESWDLDLSEWENYFYAPQVLSGREKYYWAVI